MKVLKNTLSAKEEINQMRNNRNKALIKAYRENEFALRCGFPKFKSIVVNTKLIRVPLQPPVYKTKADLLNEDNNLPFVEVLEAYTDWLYNFSGSILNSNNTDPRFTFFNAKLDYENPGISAFRIYDKELEFLQVQVRKIPEYPTMYQLDYYELEHSQFVPKMVLICDVSDEKETKVDIVLAKCSSERAAEYACRISSTFRDILIYLRPWDYNSHGSKECLVFPLFELANHQSWDFIDCPEYPELPKM